MYRARQTCVVFETDGIRRRKTSRRERAFAVQISRRDVRRDYPALPRCVRAGAGGGVRRKTRVTKTTVRVASSCLEVFACRTRVRRIGGLTTAPDPVVFSRPRLQSTRSFPGVLVEHTPHVLPDGSQSKSAKKTNTALALSPTSRVSNVRCVVLHDFRVNSIVVTRRFCTCFVSRDVL